MRALPAGIPESYLSHRTSHIAHRPSHIAHLSSARARAIKGRAREGHNVIMTHPEQTVAVSPHPLPSTVVDSGHGQRTGHGVDDMYTALRLSRSPIFEFFPRLSAASPARDRQTAQSIRSDATTTVTRAAESYDAMALAHGWSTRMISMIHRGHPIDKPSFADSESRRHTYP